MIIEASQLLTMAVADSGGNKIGTVKELVFNAAKAQAVGCRLSLPSLVKKDVALYYENILSLDRNVLVIDNAQKLDSDLKQLDQIFKLSGPVIGISAKTESGRYLGKVQDLYLDGNTGLIVRVCIRNLLKERIIPREFLVSITPKLIVFKDIVDQPIFDSVASQASA